MRSLGWALIQYDWCPYKKRMSCVTNILKDVTTKSDTGVMQLQDKEHQGLLVTSES